MEKRPGRKHDQPDLSRPGATPVLSGDELTRTFPGTLRDAPARSNGVKPYPESLRRSQPLPRQPGPMNPSILKHFPPRHAMLPGVAQFLHRKRPRRLGHLLAQRPVLLQPLRVLAPFRLRRTKKSPHAMWDDVAQMMPRMPGQQRHRPGQHGFDHGAAPGLAAILAQIIHEQVQGLEEVHRGFRLRFQQIPLAEKATGRLTIDDIRFARSL